jgi:asparagine synthase (glutamine-hydrolysing)
MAAVSPAQPLSCVTLGIPGSMDLRLAQQLAERSGRAFHPCILDAEFLRQYEHHFRRMVRLIEAQTLAIGITVPTIDLYRQLGTRVLLRGHAGELMHMHRAYSCSLDAAAFAVRDENGLEDWAVHHLAAPVFAEPGLGFLTPRYRALVEPVARAVLHEILGELVGVEPLVHRFWLLFVRHLLPGALAPSIAKFGTVVETRVPYIDADLIAALLSAAPALKLRDDVQSHILRRHAPELLTVPDSNTGAPLGATRARIALSAFAKRVLAKLGVVGYQPYERLGLWLRQEAREFVERILLSERCLDRGVFERDAVRSAIDDHAAKRRNNTYSILTMLSFELGQRELIDRGSSLPSEERIDDPAHSGVTAEIMVQNGAAPGLRMPQAASTNNGGASRSTRKPPVASKT